MDLPQLLGVDISHCETAAATAVSKSRGTLELLQGELLASSYRDSLAQESAVILQVRNQSATGSYSHAQQLVHLMSAMLLMHACFKSSQHMPWVPHRLNCLQL